MRSLMLALAAAFLLVATAQAQTATELKKELLPKIKKAQSEGKDLGEAQELYNQGDKALKDGMVEEATDFFKKAKAAMPPE